MTLIPAIVLAVLGSLGLAGGSVLQHRAVPASGRTMTTGQLAALLRRPLWLAGLLMVVAATLANLAALRLAPLVVIQPMGVLAVVWSVVMAPRGAPLPTGDDPWLQGPHRPGRADWAAVAVIFAGLAGFTVAAAASTTPVSHLPGRAAVLVAAGACVVLAACLAAVHRLPGPGPAAGARRCLLLAAAGAVCYGLTATLVKLAFMLLASGLALGSVQVLGAAGGALAACLVGGLAVQQAYTAGRAEVVVAALATIDPMVAATLGMVLLGEGRAGSAGSVVAMAASGSLAGLGVAALARLHSREVPGSPASRLTVSPGWAGSPDTAGTVLFPHGHSSAPTRIALVSDYSPATLGGAENAFANQVRALAASAEVLVACPDSRAGAQLAARAGAAYLPLPVAFIAPGLGFPVARNTDRLRATLRRAFVDAGVEAVHVHSEFGIAAAAIQVAHEMGVPAIETVHTFFWQAGAPVQPLLAAAGPAFHRLVTGWAGTRERLAECPGDSALRNMTLTTARQADAVVSPSAHQATRLRAAGLTRVDVVPNAVPDNPSARPLARVEGPLRVLWTGRFAAEKRVLPFIAAAMEAIDAVGPGRLQVDLLGTGPQFCAAARMIDETPGIRLHGRVPNTDVPAWLARSHCSVLSSVGWDNQPMTVAESIMALRGVVWCDPALTEGLSQAGIPAFGPGGLTRALIGLALDPSPVLAASAAAVDARGLFSPDSFTESALDVYRRAAAVPSPDRPAVRIESPQIVSNP